MNAMSASPLNHVKQQFKTKLNEKTRLDLMHVKTSLMFFIRENYCQATYSSHLQKY